ncbi:alpha/beta fold hydrolase [Brevundimonas sp.]|jgi:pimeloyl-ACP methyl ester carboxylesterase|uniref:alpha/beta fold hydrolase n=1 Tax=Brevundimonas sp. TaxID=1871086 RepID=UPI0037BEA51A
MTRPCLVLIPGLLNDADLWRDQVEALSPIYDVRVADITQGESLAALAEAVFAVAPDRFSIAGFSLGGYVAQEMLRRAPDRIERLALLDTAIRVDTPEKAAERRTLGRLAQASGRFLGMGDPMMRAYLSPEHAADPEMAGRVRAMTQRLGLEVFLRQNALARADGEAVLRAFTRPVLVLCGEADGITPPAGHREMADLAWDAELVVAPGCGHLTPIEAPDLVSAALGRWMRRT